MSPLTQEWVDKAEDDFKIARLLNAEQPPLLDAVCFHAQQSAEKYLKAFLVEQGVVFPYTHDLETLTQLALPAEAGLSALLSRMQVLTGHAVEFRYPGRSADQMDADDALETARLVREIIRPRLGLPSTP